MVCLRGQSITNHIQRMKFIITITSSLVLFGGLFYATPSMAGDPDDLIKLRNTWNQYSRELPTRSASTRCSGLGVMRGTAKAFMSRHGDASYAKKFNSLQNRYRCRDIAKLEYLPSSSFGAPKAVEASMIAEDESCRLAVTEILAMKNFIQKQCGETYIFIRSH